MMIIVSADALTYSSSRWPARTDVGDLFAVVCAGRIVRGQPGRARSGQLGDIGAPPALTLWNDESVSLAQRSDIEKGKRLFRVDELEARDVTPVVWKKPRLRSVEMHHR